MLKVGKAFLANTDFEASEAFIFRHQQEGRPDLVFAILISAQGEDVFSKIRHISGELEDAFFASKQPVSERFNECIKLVTGKLSTLENLQVLFACLTGEILYLQNKGQNSGYLWRGGKAVSLISTDPLSSGGSFGQLISGYLQEGDRVLFMSEDVNHLFSTGRGLEQLIQADIDSLEDELEQMTVSSSTLSPSAVILFSLEPDQSVENETTTQARPPRLTLPKLNLKIHFPLKEVARAIYINRETFVPKGPRQWGIVALVLGLLLVFVLSGWVIWGQVQARNNQFNLLLTLASTSLNQARSAKDTNPTQAKIDYENAKTSVKKALTQRPKDLAALKLSEEIAGASNEILKVATIGDWPVFLNLNLIKDGFVAKRVSLSQTDLALFDENQKTLVSFDLANKSNQILGGSEQLGQVELASINGDFVFSYSPDKGVVRVDIRLVKPAQVVKPEPDWGKVKDLVAFAGNIYLLDSVKNNIWKYIPTASGYSDKNSYLDEQEKADFLGAKRMLIDGSVWILKSGAEILKYTSGRADFFEFANIDDSSGKIADLKSFFVSDETENIYLLDSEHSRVVVLKKNGEYLSQLIGDKFKTADDLFVQEQEKKLYLLESNTIYQVNLN